MHHKTVLKTNEGRARNIEIKTNGSYSSFSPSLHGLGPLQSFTSYRSVFLFLGSYFLNFYFKYFLSYIVLYGSFNEINFMTVKTTVFVQNKPQYI